MGYKDSIPKGIQFAEPIESPNKLAAIDAHYGPYLSLEDGNEAMKNFAKIGRLFTVITDKGIVDFFIWQGPIMGGVPVTSEEALRNMANTDLVLLEKRKHTGKEMELAMPMVFSDSQQRFSSLLDKKDDYTFEYLAVLNSKGDMAKGNGFNLLLNAVTDLTDIQRKAYITALGGTGDGKAYLSVSHTVFIERGLAYEIIITGTGITNIPSYGAVVRLVSTTSPDTFLDAVTYEVRSGGLFIASFVIPDNYPQGIFTVTTLSLSESVSANRVKIVSKLIPISVDFSKGYTFFNTDNNDKPVNIPTQYEAGINNLHIKDNGALSKRFSYYSPVFIKNNQRGKILLNIRGLIAGGTSVGRGGVAIEVSFYKEDYNKKLISSIGATINGTVGTSINGRGVGNTPVFATTVGNILSSAISKDFFSTTQIDEDILFEYEVSNNTIIVRINNETIPYSILGRVSNIFNSSVKNMGILIRSGEGTASNIEVSFKEFKIENII